MHPAIGWGVTQVHRDTKGWRLSLGIILPCVKMCRGSQTTHGNFDFKLTLDAKIQPVFTGRARKAVAFDISWHGHSLVMIYIQFLWSDWSKLDRWVHAENLWSIWKLVYLDSWNWQSFVLSTCDVFNYLFPLDVQNIIQLLSRFFCYSWLACLLGFWLTNVPLVKVIGNPISHGVVSFFTLLDE